MALNKYGIEIPDRADYGSMDTYMLAVSDVAAKTRKAAAKEAQEAAAKEASSSGSYNVAEAQSNVAQTITKPNMREFMDATGASSKEASEILYGTIGSNQDTRDWGAIMASGDPVEAAIQANFEQYSTGAATSATDKTQYPTFVNPDGTKAGIVKTGTGFALVSSDGVPLRAGFNSLEQAQEQGKYFGITDFLGDSVEMPAIKESSSVASQPAVSQPAVSQPAVSLEAGQVPVVQPVPQTVTQQVTPPSYYNQPQIAANTFISNEKAGTFSKPLQTAGLSAVPTTATYKTHYAGTPGLVDPTLVAPTGGMDQAIYQNSLGQQMTVTEMNGAPTSYVPPGFIRQGTVQQVQQSSGMATGGSVQGYSKGGDAALIKIASMNGFSGDDPDTALAFMKGSEGLRNKLKAMGSFMSRGGLALAEGGLLPAVVPSLTMQNQLASNMMPAQANVQYIQPQAADFVPVDAGQATPIAPYAEAATVQTVQQANQQVAAVPQTVTPVTAAALVKNETDAMQPAQGTVSAPAQVTGAQQQTSAVTGMQGAQGVSTDVVAPAPRVEMTGELIEPVADATSAAAFTEQVQAATATPSAQATVAGQLEGLMQQFEGGNTPAWAAGSMRNATATLAARGLGASSMAGQAIIQATMEAALPIAQMDAQVQAQFEGQNLSNRQQRAMLSAQQRAQFIGMEFDQAFQARVQNSARIGDIANMNFTAEQNIALENSRAANTMNLNNLSNRQAMIMSEAAALANLDMANLNNRQQAAVQNAQSFLQMDMANLSNSQQTEMFKTQQNVQALFTDQAAENAAKQFNASSKNQTDQYFANLRNQTSQFNASQQNAMDQFNVNSVNALREFNSQVQQQRDLFNAQNGLVIAQANAQWRQNLSTINTAAQNEANASAALAANAFTQSTLDTLWQRERDIMDYVYKASEAGKDRALSVVLADKKYAEYATARADAEETAEWETLIKIATT